MSVERGALIVPTVDRLPPLDPPVRLGVLASGTGTNFVALCEAVREGRLQAEIAVLIYNKPDAKVAIAAEQFGVPAVLLDHRGLTRAKLDRTIVEELKRRGVEWVAMAGWMRIVTSELIAAFPGRILNIHPSLLPSFKGTQAIEQAIAAGVKVTGCTVHFVSEEVDSGAIVMQAAVPVSPDDTAATLHARIQPCEHEIFPKAIALAVSRDRAPAG